MWWRAQPTDSISHLDNSASGLIFSLVAKGNQDKALRDLGTETFKDRFLADSQYSCQFTRCSHGTVSGGVTTFRLEHNCDAVNNLVLILHNPTRSPLNSLLKKVTLEIGGQIVDCFDGTDIEQVIATVAALNDRKIQHFGDYTFVPLAMAAFHADDIYPIGHIAHHEARLNVKTTKSVSMSLWGNQYVFDFELHNDLKSLEQDKYVTSQVQHEEAPLISGVNRVPLYFHHPLTHIALCGVQKDLLKRVKFEINGHTLIDRTTEILEFEKHSAKLDCDAIILFLAESNDYRTAVNASKIDSMALIVETEQTSGNLHVLARNLNIAQFGDKMFGMAYTS